jgi:hypothetical protein
MAAVIVSFSLESIPSAGFGGEVAFSKGGRRAACLLPFGMSTENQFTTYLHFPKVAGVLHVSCLLV